MATSKADLKQRFATGTYPTGNDFSNLIEAFFHKNESIKRENIEGLNEVLSAKVSKTELEALQTNLASESTRAKNAETALQNNINAEQTRAKQAEKTLDDSITALGELCGKTFATKTELSDEKQRAEGKEIEIENSIKSLNPKLLKGTLYLSDDETKIYTDNAKKEEYKLHGVENVGLWFIRGNTKIGLFVQAVKEALIYSHSGSFVLPYKWDDESDSWERDIDNIKYTITPGEKAKWNKAITDIANEQQRAEGAEQILENSTQRFVYTNNVLLNGIIKELYVDFDINTLPETLEPGKNYELAAFVIDRGRNLNIESSPIYSWGITVQYNCPSNPTIFASLSFNKVHGDLSNEAINDFEIQGLNKATLSYTKEGVKKEIGEVYAVIDWDKIERSKDTNNQIIIRPGDKELFNSICRNYKHSPLIQSYFDRTIKRPNTEGCVFMSLGDSITTEAYSFNKKLREHLKPSKYYNLAVSGARWADYPDTDSYDGNPIFESGGSNYQNIIGNQLQKIINNPATYNVAPDIIIIAAGTNDTQLSPITSLSSNQEMIKEIDSHYIDDGGNVIPVTEPTFSGEDTYMRHRKTIPGAMRYVVCKLQQMYPNAKIYILTPIQACNGTRNYKDNIEVKQRYITECAKHLAIPVIHVGEECGIQSDFEYLGAMWSGRTNNSYEKSGRDLLDGIHPNESGGTKMADYVAKRIINDNVL